jgi:hypothetical protein
MKKKKKTREFGYFINILQILQFFIIVALVVIVAVGK